MNCDSENGLTSLTTAERRSEERQRVKKKEHTVSPLGLLIQNAMKSLGLSYQQIVSASNLLAANQNPDMRIGKSTLGNIITGSIRQPSTAKLDSLRIILHLNPEEIDAAVGLVPERRLAEQLRIHSHRTYEVTSDSITRHRQIKFPVVRKYAQLSESQFLSGMVHRWINLDVEYLGSFYPPHLKYVVVGEDDFHALPVAPPRTRMLVNTLLKEVRPVDHTNFHERELYCVHTPYGLTCSYLEKTATRKIILVPHPLAGHVREEFSAQEVTVMGQVVGLLFPEFTRTSSDHDT